MELIEQEVRVRCPEREIEATLVLPKDEDDKPRPAVVVIHEIFGPDAHIKDVARRFARQGYAAIAANLFTGELSATLTPANIALAMQAFAQAPPDLRRRSHPVRRVRGRATAGAPPGPRGLRSGLEPSAAREVRPGPARRDPVPTGPSLRSGGWV